MVQQLIERFQELSAERPLTKIELKELMRDADYKSQRQLVTLAAIGRMFSPEDKVERRSPIIFDDMHIQDVKNHELVEYLFSRQKYVGKGVWLAKSASVNPEDITVEGC